MAGVDVIVLISLPKYPHHGFVLILFENFGVLFASPRQLATAIDPAHHDSLEMIGFYLDSQHCDSAQQNLGFVVLDAAHWLLPRVVLGLPVPSVLTLPLLAYINQLLVYQEIPDNWVTALGKVGTNDCTLVVVHIVEDVVKVVVISHVAVHKAISAEKKKE